MLRVEFDIKHFGKTGLLSSFLAEFFWCSYLDLYNCGDTVSSLADMSSKAVTSEFMTDLCL